MHYFVLRSLRMWLFGKTSFFACLCFVILPWKAYSLIEIFEPEGIKVDTFYDEELLTPALSDTMEGYMSWADPPEACTEIKEPEFISNFTFRRFVLIKGDSCGSWFITSDFDTKRENAAKAGFDLAVLVTDWFPPHPIRESSHAGHQLGSAPKIPSTLLRTKDESRMQKYLYNISSSVNYKIKVSEPDITVVGYVIIGIFVGAFILALGVYPTHLLIQYIRERRVRRGNAYQVPVNTPPEGDNVSEAAPEDSELASPGDNKPLLVRTSSSNQGNTWGTFENRLHVQETEASRPV